MKLTAWQLERQIEEERAARYGLELDHEQQDREHDERHADQDRLADKAPARFAHLAYVERPSDRERRQHYDEHRARRDLYQRRTDSQVTPLGRKAA